MSRQTIPSKAVGLTLPSASSNARRATAPSPSPSSSAHLSGNLSEASEIARLKQELDAGEEHISALQTELDTCKEETLKLRSKAASVALSLETLKEELHELLQSEAELRSNSQHEPVEEGNTEKPENLHCHATLCALTGQLEATRAAVEKAVHERDDLLRKMSEDGTMAVGEEDESPREVSALTFLDRLLAVEEDADDEPGEMNLIRRLNSQATERSTYRDDHAKIWRDTTLPNVALLRAGASEAHCGVVSERLFAGLTEFTALGADGFVAEHCYLSSCSNTEPITQEQFETVRAMYSALVLKDRTSKKNLRVLAPRQALERVLQLVKTAADHTTPTPLTPRTPNTPKSGSLSTIASVTSAGTSNPSESGTGKLKSEAQKKRKSKPSIRRPGPHLSEASHVLSAEHFRFLVQECIPVRFHESDVSLLYSTNNDGMSVHTLYQKCKGVKPTILAIRDNNGAVFGCYAASPWNEKAFRYYGTGESFVFSCRPRLAVYKWNRRGGNSFFQFSHGDILAIGGGDDSHYALWVDEDLIGGTTAKCATFGSPPLNMNAEDAAAAAATADKVDFEITALEVWTVVPRTHGHTR